MYEFFPMGLFLLGLLGGLPVSAVVVRLPYAVEHQWLLDASETLGIARNPDAPGQLGLAWRPDHFSLRVGLTMLAMGLLAGWVGLHYGVGPAALAAVVLVAGLLALSLIDLEHQLLPDVLVLPLLWLGLIVNSVELFTSLTSAVWGAVGGYLVLWLLRGVSKLFSDTEGMGQGDLKLLAMLGAWGLADPARRAVDVDPGRHGGVWRGDGVGQNQSKKPSTLRPVPGRCGLARAYVHAGLDCNLTACGHQYFTL